ncbi:MAG: hypothetical protein KDC71_13615 [Acidobacteria bacterium]|nr:hypothetical protein [Acidobacteriota bacterium]
MEAEAERVREVYVAYFRQQKGFVGSTFYRSLEGSAGSGQRYINIVVWDSEASYSAVVNLGFGNAEGLNADGMKVLGKGFPEPIQVSPGRFEIIAQ